MLNHKRSLASLSHRRLAVLLGLFFLLSAFSCSQTYMLVDRTGMTFFVEKVKLEGNLEVIDGESTRKIPLEAISRIVIDPSQTFFRQDKLYYFSVVELLDGTQIKPRQNGREVTKSFVCINNKVRGKTPNGKLELPLEDVNVLQISKK